MPKFVAKEANPDEPCFVVDEESDVVFRLKGKAAIEDAVAAATWLNHHIRLVDLDGNGLPPTRRRT